MANRRLNDLSAGSNPMPPMATSPITATTGTKSPTNPATGAVNPSYKNKTASLYSRIMGKKTDSAVTARQSPASVVKGGLAAADSLINYFFKDSEESKMRSFLKSYQKKLRAELIDANRAVARHEKRLNDQIIEFEQQERQLKCWGLGQIVPNFRLQAWCRLQRARVVASAACSYQQLLCNKVERTNEYMLQLQESSNSKGKFSLESCLELCLPPEDLLGRDYTAILQSQKLLRLDIVCSTYIKRFRVLEAELRQLNQKPRESVLIAILSDYANIVANDRKISERIEWDITWEEFCDWYAERKTRLQELGERFSAFVEDQREKEGRLFNRWCTSLLGVQDETNTLLLFPVMGSGDAGNNTNGTSIGSASSDHGGIESSIRRMSTDTSIQSQITPISATGVAKVDRTMPSSNPVTNPMTVSTNPTAAFKMTPTSIKAFVKYFANDVLGITYAVPKDLQEANFILTEALFYKRIHQRVFKYNSRSLREKDERWRTMCQFCRFIDPAAYYVPPEYAFGSGSRPLSKPPSPVPQTEPPLYTYSVLKIVTKGRSSNSSSSTDGKKVDVKADVSPGVSTHSGTPKSNSYSTTYSNSSSTSDNYVSKVQNTAEARIVNTDIANEPIDQSVVMGSSAKKDTTIKDLNVQRNGTILGNTPSNRILEDGPTGLRSVTSAGSLITDNTNTDAFFVDSPGAFVNSRTSSPTLLEADRNDSTLPPRIDEGHGGSDGNENKRSSDRHSKEDSEDLIVLGTECIAEYYSPNYSRQHSAVDVDVQIIEEVIDSSINIGKKDEYTDDIAESALANFHPEDSNNSKVRHLKQGLKGHEYPMPSDGQTHAQRSPSLLSRYCCQSPACKCRTMSMSRRLQRLPHFKNDTNGMRQYGDKYARSSRVMSFLTTAVTPKDIIMNLQLAYRWLLRDAIDVSGSRNIIGADLLVPLFTLVLINAQVPNVHTILEFLLDYGDYDEQGDISYTIANLEGSIMFIMDVEVPNDVLEHVQNSEMYQSIIASMQANRRRNSSTAGNPVNPNLANLPNSPKYYPFADSQIALEKIQKGVIKPNIVGRDIKDRSEKEVSLINSDIQSEIAIPVRLDSTRSASGSKGTSQSPKRSLDITTSQDEREAFIRLGEWLRDQQTMEDTINILQKEGWML